MRGEFVGSTSSNTGLSPLTPTICTHVDGIPCTSLARSVVDVCGVVDADLASERSTTSNGDERA